MPKSVQLTKTFHIIIERMIATGQAPNYTEISAELGVLPSEGRKALRKLFSTLGFPGWFSRKTDDIESFAPFSISSNLLYKTHQVGGEESTALQFHRHHYRTDHQG